MEGIVAVLHAKCKTAIDSIKVAVDGIGLSECEVIDLTKYWFEVVSILNLDETPLCLGDEMECF